MQALREMSAQCLGPSPSESRESVTLPHEQNSRITIRYLNVLQFSHMYIAKDYCQQNLFSQNANPNLLSQKRKFHQDMSPLPRLTTNATRRPNLLKDTLIPRHKRRQRQPPLLHLLNLRKLAVLLRGVVRHGQPLPRQAIRDRVLRGFRVVDFLGDFFAGG